MSRLASRCSVTLWPGSAPSSPGSTTSNVSDGVSGLKAETSGCGSLNGVNDCEDVFADDGLRGGMVINRGFGGLVTVVTCWTEKNQHQTHSDKRVKYRFLDLGVLFNG